MTGRLSSVTASLLCALAAMLGSACFLDMGEAVPCREDGHCPSGYFCEFNVQRCVKGQSQGGPGDPNEDVDEGEDTDPPDDVLVDVPPTDCEPGEPGCDLLPCDPVSDPQCVLEPDVVDEPPEPCTPSTDPYCIATRGACPDGMGRVVVDESTRYCVDLFEASRRDATAQIGGIDNSAATSRMGVQPWTGVAYEQAEQACAASGKRLCTEGEWRRACQGPELWIFPYPGIDWQRTTCNGLFYRPGDPADAMPALTGEASGCLSADGVYDMSGNVAEWVQRRRMHGGFFSSQRNELLCTAPGVDPDRQGAGVPGTGRGFRCCADYPGQ